MADRGIIFSGAMVRALLEGRKSQTRRLCEWANNPNSPALTYIVACNEPGWFGDEEGEVQFKVPYAVGDRLYVRERGWISRSLASPSFRFVGNELDAPKSPDGTPYKARPSIHMSRWASRLWLLVTDVRVQRLQDISEADAIAEGIERHAEYPTLWKRGPLLGDQNTVDCTNFPLLAYRSIWESLHSKPGTRWADNPWIVAVTFDVRKGNIDAG